MATPTDQQQIRATIRRHARTAGDYAAARLAAQGAIDVVGFAQWMTVALDMLPEPYRDEKPLPPLLGAAEAADVLGMKATNLKRLSPPLPVAAVISGRIPVYRESDVMAAKERRDARRAAA
jgi:hypothetical protein